MAPDSKIRVGGDVEWSTIAGIFEFGFAATKPLELLAFLDVDQISVVLGLGLPELEQLLEHQRDLDPVRRREQ